MTRTVGPASRIPEIDDTGPHYGTGNIPSDSALPTDILIHMQIDHSYFKTLHASLENLQRSLMPLKLEVGFIAYSIGLSYVLDRDLNYDDVKKIRNLFVGE